ncbi:MAG: MAPEG family protein [Oceanococcus sp.]
MLQNSPILLPLAILVLWSIFMLFWTAGVRVPAMIKLRMHPQKYPRTQDLSAALPANVQWKADNYNHLMEQPTLFYAVVLALAVMGEGSTVNLVLAWAYVVSRIIHSLIHATTNTVIHRFRVFIMGTLILLALGVSLLISVIRI